MSSLKVTQRKSLIGGTKAQRNSMRSLGLKRIGDTVVQPDRPEIRGMVNTVSHLVDWEVVDAPAGGAAASAPEPVEGNTK